MAYGFLMRRRTDEADCLFAEYVCVCACTDGMACHFQCNFFAEQWIYIYVSTRVCEIDPFFLLYKIISHKNIDTIRWNNYNVLQNWWSSGYSVLLATDSHSHVALQIYTNLIPNLGQHCSRKEVKGGEGGKWRREACEAGGKNNQFPHCADSWAHIIDIIGWHTDRGTLIARVQCNNSAFSHLFHYRWISNGKVT